MSLFLSLSERDRLRGLAPAEPAFALLDAMEKRVRRRCASPGLSDRCATTDWWHHAAEYLTDAALVQAVRPSPVLATWLHSTVLALVRRPLADWAGPPFRGFNGGELVGSLETAHLTWGLAVSYDLVADLFSADEQTEIRTVLRERGQAPCRRYIDATGFCHNWNCVLLAGFTVAAAVLDDAGALAEAAAWFPVAADHFQPDGSYGESLQYANYAAFSIILAREALLRRSPGTPPTLEPYARIVDWAAQALLYRKPLSGWGPSPRARSANFGDSAALFRPSGDLLIHIAAHARATLPREAGLARWLFDTLYFPADEDGPHDLASFGFVPGFGFLSVILLPDAAAALAPKAVDLPLVAAFSGGDAFARDDRDGLTVLAVRTAAEPRHATAHLHGDIHSFILAHRSERLLIDPGHSCYRNLTHDLEAASLTHNTCTFDSPASTGVPARNLTQRGGINRPLVREAGALRGGAPVGLGGSRLLCARSGPVSVLGSEAAALYGAPLTNFTRLWFLCGPHALFVVDRIEAETPLRTTWHWLLNNRDGQLNLQLLRPDQLIARRGGAGLKLRHFGGGRLSGPVYAHVHDAYHPLPAQLGEGRPGSGLLLRYTESEPFTARTVVHGIAVDDSAAAVAWDLSRTENTFVIQAPTSRERWSLELLDTEGSAFRLNESITRQSYEVRRSDSREWSLACY